MLKVIFFNFSRLDKPFWGPFAAWATQDQRYLQLWVASTSTFNYIGIHRVQRTIQIQKTFFGFLFNGLRIPLFES